MWFDKCVGVSCHEILGERFGHSQALYVMKVVRALRSIEIYPALSDLFFLTHCNVESGQREGCGIVCERRTSPSMVCTSQFCTSQSDGLGLCSSLLFDVAAFSMKYVASIGPYVL